MKDYTNSHITYLIAEHIHSARDRRIMMYHYVEGLSADMISRIDEDRKDLPKEARIDLTPLHISRILAERLLEIDKYL